MACSILFVSCTKDYVRFPSQQTIKAETPVQQNSNAITCTATSAMYSDLHNFTEQFIAVNGYDEEALLNAMNAHITQNYNSPSVDPSQLTLIKDEYYFHTESPSISPFITKLKENEGMSDNVYQKLIWLDNVMSDELLSYEDAITNLNSFQEMIDGDALLTSEEVNQLTNMTCVLISMYDDELQSINGVQDRMSCGDCLWKNKWKIFGIGAIYVAIFMIGCAGAAGPLVVASVGLILINYYEDINKFCPQCFGENPNDCENPTCPPGYTYDEANCASGICVPDGSEPFVWNTGFYIHATQPGNICSVGTWDGAHCIVANVPAGFSGFVFNNCFYVKPDCD